MKWFNDLCRNLGLMVHNIKHPEGKHSEVVKKETQETRRGNVTLRRTTIEEIEYDTEDDDNEPRP
ncbi:MAG: hypothetical protein WD294_12995 [Phycisphaeraceae bacterium]